MKTKEEILFEEAPVGRAVLSLVIPTVISQLITVIYNMADTFFIGQTHDDLQVAAVSLATPVFLLFMSVGTVFGIGGTSVISRALCEGRRDYAKKSARSVCGAAWVWAFSCRYCFWSSWIRFSR